MPFAAPAFVQRLKARYAASRPFRWAVDLVVVFALITLVGLFQTRHHPRGEAPAYVFQTLDHQAVSLASFAGKPTLLAVWAPWCGVCKAESDNVSRAWRWLGGRANVVSVATQFTEEAQVRRYMQDQHVDYPVLLAGDDFAALLHVGAFPTLFVLDSQGRIVGSVEGYTTTLGLLARAWWAG
ncbi:MAG: redoxin family protein [Myxococcaceae bacterium]